MILKSIKGFFGWILLGVNGLASALMLLSAFSSYINPYSFPVLSCAGLAFPLFLLLNILFLFFWLMFNRKYALLPFMVLLVCGGQIRAYIPLNIFAEDAPDGAIKVLSYNVMAFDSHTPHLADAPNEMVQYILNNDADIVCLQEVSFNGANPKKFLSEKIFRKAMSEYSYYSFYKGRGNGWLCLSRYPILSSHMIDYESVGNGTMAYELKVGEDTLLLVNNHLESNKLSKEERAAYREMIKDPKEEKVKSTGKMLISKLAEAIPLRAAQADSVAKYIRDSGHKYVLVCGDFNDSPLSYAHRVIGEGLNDAFIESGRGVGISYNRNGMFFRIDHIMASESLELFDCRVDNSVKASDHYPIWCYIKKK